jgi:hypothetical protein
MLNRKTIISLLLILSAAGLACRTAFGGPLAAADPGVLFQDDFSQPDGQWSQYTDSVGSAAYELDGFRLQVAEPERQIWSLPDLDLQDVQIDVDTRRISGPDDNMFGLICRYQNEQNFYAFLASSDGYFAITRIENNVQTVLSGISMQITDAIEPGRAENHLQARCAGSRLTFMINNTVVAEVVDQAFLSGDIGLIAGSFSEPGTDILFDNLIIRNPYE